MKQFDDIRPFNDDEIPAAIEILLKEEYFRRAMAYVNADMDSFFEDLSKVRTSEDFQKTVLFPFIRNLAGYTSDSLENIGFENIDSSKAYTYISNHRDILLDATFLGLLLDERGIPTPEIALGDNLLVYPWMNNLVRMNKSIIVYRNMPLIKTHEEAHRLSGYINYTLKENGHSVWIAQREGRAKDSNDRTQESVIKMLAMEGGEDMKSNVMALNILPVSISYEYDPCDYLKAREFQLKRDNPCYKKAPKDDLTSMSTGLLGKKGNICFTIAKSINPEIDNIPDNLSRAEFFAAVAV
ncbi:MAG: 1-acyl-sn-glycerol-3-phosphate acyltransferase, partial [Bacteroidales bacterium]